MSNTKPTLTALRGAPLAPMASAAYRPLKVNDQVALSLDAIALSGGFASAVAMLPHINTVVPYFASFRARRWLTNINRFRVVDVLIEGCRRDGQPWQKVELEPLNREGLSDTDFFGLDVQFDPHWRRMLVDNYDLALIDQEL